MKSLYYSIIILISMFISGCGSDDNLTAVPTSGVVPTVTTTKYSGVLLGKWNGTGHESGFYIQFNEDNTYYWTYSQSDWETGTFTDNTEISFTKYIKGSSDSSLISKSATHKYTRTANSITIDLVRSGQSLQYIYVK